MTIRQSIISDDDLRQLIEKSRAMPQRMQHAQDLLDAAQTELDYYRGVEEAKANVTRIEGEVLFEVGLETNGDGKKVYSNAEQREMAMRKNLVNNDEYRAAMNAVIQCEKHRMALQMEMFKRRNTVLAVKAESFNISDILKVAAGLCVEESNNERIEKVSRIAGIIERADREIKEVHCG